MNRLITLLAFIVPSLLYAQTAEDLEVITWDVPMLPEHVTLDGVISPGEYEDAVTIELDYEVDPGLNATPKLQSWGYVYRGQDALIVAFRCVFDPSDFRATLTRRDEAWEGDFIGIALDVYGDTRNMVYIGSNPYGVQLDIKKNDPNSIRDNFDISYNVNFESWAHIDSNFYTVEMRIPFSSLQFSSKNEQRWKFSFFRQYFVDGVMAHSQTYFTQRQIPCSDCQYTDILNLDGIKPGIRAEIIPYAFGAIQPNAGEFNPSGKWGGSGFLAINSETSAELAVNPDFSQVEADQLQVDVNAAFALLYPERRPFFNEGADFLESRLKYVYTRSIANPSALAKAIYQGDGTRAYILTGYDRNSPYLASGENYSSYGTSEGNWSSIMKIERPLPNSSSVGVLTTHRVHDGGGFGNTMAVDANLQFKGGWLAQAEIARTETQEPIADWVTGAEDFDGYTGTLDGEHFSGNAMFLKLQKQRKISTTRMDFMALSPTFRPEMGFEPRNNLRRYEIGQGFRIFPNKKYFKQGGMYTEVTHLETFSSLVKRQGIMTHLWATWANNISTRLNFKYDLKENYLGQDFHNPYRVGLGLGWNPTQSFGFHFGGGAGQVIAYNEAVPRMGNSLDFGTAITIRIAGKLMIVSGLEYAHMTEIDNGADIYRGYLTNNVLNYSINRASSIRLVAQYNNFAQTWLIQPLVQYQPNAFSLYYVGGAWSQGQYQMFMKIQRQIDVAKRR